MPQPIPFQRRLPPHLAPPPPRPRESSEDRQERQLGLTRELTELNMLAARDAAHRIATRDPDQPAEAPAAQEPTLALARATRAVTTVINLENRIAAGEKAAAFTVEDPRGLALRKLLHPLVAREPDQVRRRALKTSLNDRIDDALGADLDDDLPLGQIAAVIAAEHGLTLDISTLPDEFLYPPSAVPAPRYRPEADNRDHR